MPCSTMAVRRSSPNFSVSSINSCLIMPSNLAFDFRMLSSSLIKARFSFNSFSILRRSKLTKEPSFISTIAKAWRSLNLNFFIKLSLASSLSLEALMVLITASILFRAIIKPSKICARSRAFSNSNSVRRRTTSSRCLIYSSKKDFKLSTFG